MKSDSWIQTFTGKVFRPFAPDPLSISIADIAHALSMICRFNGHTKFHYSVAQHSVKVSMIVSPELALQALLHDGAEYVVCDLPKPIKAWLPEYVALEQVVWYAIADRFAVPKEIHPDVHRADRIALATEVRDLMAQPPASWGQWLDGVSPLTQHIAQMSPTAAEQAFMSRFTELTRLQPE